MWNVKRDETMTEIKDYLVMMVGAVFSLLSPIQGFMWAMVCLFALNFGFGLLAAIVKKEDVGRETSENINKEYKLWKIKLI